MICFFHMHLVIFYEYSIHWLTGWIYNIFVCVNVKVLEKTMWLHRIIINRLPISREVSNFLVYEKCFASDRRSKKRANITSQKSTIFLESKRSYYENWRIFLCIYRKAGFRAEINWILEIPEIFDTRDTLIFWKSENIRIVVLLNWFVVVVVNRDFFSFIFHVYLIFQRWV